MVAETLGANPVRTVSFSLQPRPLIATIVALILWAQDCPCGDPTRCTAMADIAKLISALETAIVLKAMTPDAPPSGKATT